MPITNAWRYFPPRLRDLLHQLGLISEVTELVPRPARLGGIVAPRTGQASSRGAQVFGTARMIQRTAREADHYWEAVRWQSDHVERGRPLTDPPTDPLTVITPTRIVYTDHWLRRAGYAPRQRWTPQD